MSYRDDLTSLERRILTLEDRMRRAETGRQLVLGEWVIELVGPSGAGQILQARNTTTATTVVLATA